MSSAHPTTAARAAAPRVMRLSEVIEAYNVEQKGKLDECALKLLARLAKSSDAAKAFQSLKLGRCKVTPFLVTCIQAEHLSRTFPDWITKAESKLAQAKLLGNAVVALRTFMDEQIAVQSAPPIDPLSMWATSELLGWPAHPAESAALQRGHREMLETKRVLNRIAEWIELDQDIAKQNMLRLGATRKKGLKADDATVLQTAAENAGIAWLAAGVRRLKKRPHARTVAELSNVILITKTVSEDRVRHAAAFRKRERRQP